MHRPNEVCPKCKSENIYQDGLLWICPECSCEWIQNQAIESEEVTVDTTVRDVNGIALVDGDSVVVIKDLKVKGSSASIEGGTKIKNIRLIDMGDGHNFSCKIDGMGTINLKSEFVRKA